ncbi:MAG TPA: ABC transporter permease [Candidatus Saccharimonadia bacterium]|nr:ABC transporter permease [Candidatus Saccharimonadia bacterium]
MKLLDIFLTASSNLTRSKLRTFLTIIAIFIGAFTLTITSGIGAGISQYIDQQLGNLGANNVLIVTPKMSNGASGSSSTPAKYDPTKKVAATGGFGQGSNTVLTSADINKIAAHPGITSVVPDLVIAADYIQGNTAGKYQVTISENLRGTNLDLAAGNDVDDSSSQYQLVLPSSYVSSLGYSSAQDAIGNTTTIAVTNALGKQQTGTGTIVGVQQPGIVGGDSVTMNKPMTQSLYNLQTTGLPPATKGDYQIVAATFNSDLTASQVTTLKNDLSNQGYTAETIQDRIGTFKTVISAIIDVLDAFAVIALLAASFGIINTLLMAVQERTKEIGLMKSMGMGSGRIFLLFSAEAVMIGFWGSLLGVAVAYGVGHAADHILSKGFLKDLPGLQIVAFPIRSIALIMLIIMAIAFLAGTLPARRAAKQNPIDALRYE